MNCWLPLQNAAYDPYPVAIPSAIRFDGLTAGFRISLSEKELAGITPTVKPLTGDARKDRGSEIGKFLLPSGFAGVPIGPADATHALYCTKFGDANLLFTVGPILKKMIEILI